jgi:FtsZ-binding cell division protein ZapB
MKELDEVNEKVRDLTAQVCDLRSHCHKLETENAALRQEVTITKRKLRVYDAFFEKEELMNDSRSEERPSFSLEEYIHRSPSPSSRNPWSASSDFQTETYDNVSSDDNDYSRPPDSLHSTSLDSRGSPSAESVAIRLARLRELKSFVGSK